MNRDEFEAKLIELTDFSYSRVCALPEKSEDRAAWARIFMALDQAKLEIPE